MRKRLKNTIIIIIHGRILLSGQKTKGFPNKNNNTDDERGEGASVLSVSRGDDAYIRVLYTPNTGTSRGAL